MMEALPRSQMHHVMYARSEEVEASEVGQTWVWQLERRLHVERL